jgi:uncharacterized protein YodC (DUF2158 family)
MGGEPLYYAQGAAVYKRPVERPSATKPGASDIAMGFRVCVVADGLGADAIARMLCVAEQANASIGHRAADTCADAADLIEAAWPVGSIAFLKSGGPRMTVTMTSPTTVTCQWFKSATEMLEEQDFDPDCLSRTPSELWGTF